MAITPKTAKQLWDTALAGGSISGLYQIDRPLVLTPERPTLVGHTIIRPTIRAAFGAPAIIAGWAEPKLPAELWTKDGGVRLLDKAGRTYRITATPGSTFAHPGRPPLFWSGITKCEWTFDFALATYAAGTSAALFGIIERSDNSPSPIYVISLGGQAIVYVKDSVGIKQLAVPYASTTAGARNRLKITVDGGKMIGDGGKGVVSVTLDAPLVDNIDAVFNVGAIAPTAFAGDFSAPGDLTVYGFTFAFSPGQFATTDTLSLTLPARLDWWAPPGAILHCPVDATASWDCPPIRIANLDIETGHGDRGGAGILIGYTQKNVPIRDCAIGGFHLGVANLGGSYTVAIDDTTFSHNGIAAVSLYQCIATLRNVGLAYSGRDCVVNRGSDLTIDGGLVAPAGSGDPATNRATTFRVMPWEDPCRLTVRGVTVDDEGTEPTIAHLVADSSACNQLNRLRIAFRDCTFGVGERFAVLIGSPKVGKAGSLTLDGVTCQAASPKVEASAGWRVDGEVVGFRGPSVPTPIPAVTP